MNRSLLVCLLQILGGGLDQPAEILLLKGGQVHLDMVGDLKYHVEFEENSVSFAKMHLWLAKKMTVFSIEFLEKLRCSERTLVFHALRH